MDREAFLVKVAAGSNASLSWVRRMFEAIPGWAGLLGLTEPERPADDPGQRFIDAQFEFILTSRERELAFWREREESRGGDSIVSAIGRSQDQAAESMAEGVYGT